MDLQELSASIARLFRAHPEVVVAFVLSGLFTIGLGLLIRRWATPGPPGKVELARLGAELTRNDARIVALERQLDGLRDLRVDGSDLGPALEDRAGFPSGPSAEVDRLNLALATSEAEVADLRSRLAASQGEVQHWTKWARVFEEENARLKGLATQDES